MQCTVARSHLRNCAELDVQERALPALCFDSGRSAFLISAAEARFPSADRVLRAVYPDSASYASFASACFANVSAAALPSVPRHLQAFTDQACIHLQLSIICDTAGASIYVISAGAFSPGVLQHVSSKVGRLQVQRRLC